ncbi:MAG: nitroreductase family protein [Chloroflexota bacterium]
MNFLELAEKRYSSRAYKPDPVEDSKLRQVLEAVRLAPSAHNLQPIRLIVIKTKGREADIGRIYHRDWLQVAPIVICICIITSESWARKDGKLYGDVDAAIAIDHLTLAAADLGLGTCWIGSFDPEATREILKLPEGVEPIAFTPLGYPVDAPREKKRKPISELVSYEHW